MTPSVILWSAPILPRRRSDIVRAPDHGNIMAKRLSLFFLSAASPLLLLSLLVDIPAGEVFFAVLAVAFPLALIVPGAGHRGGLGPLLVPLVLLIVFYEACAVAMLALRGQVLEAPWVGGLPLATAIQFYGVFLLPMVFVALLYALTFERFGLRREDLDELRRRFRRREDGED